MANNIDVIDENKVSSKGVVGELIKRKYNKVISMKVNKYDKFSGKLHIELTCLNTKSNKEDSCFSKVEIPFTDNDFGKFLDNIYEGKIEIHRKLTLRNIRKLRKEKKGTTFTISEENKLRKEVYENFIIKKDKKTWWNGCNEQ